MTVDLGGGADYPAPLIERMAMTFGHRVSKAERNKAKEQVAIWQEYGPLIAVLEVQLCQKCQHRRPIDSLCYYGLLPVNKDGSHCAYFAAVPDG